MEKQKHKQASDAGKTSKYHAEEQCVKSREANKQAMQERQVRHHAEERCDENTDVNKYGAANAG